MASLLTDRVPALDDADEDKYDCENKKDMDGPADYGKGKETHGPEDDEYDCDCYKHVFILLVIKFY